ncbi:heat shock protein 70 family [Flagelloscypha sp. PMI_526]|nr:heat shock protein 70 family [Flagelloscypha sp. PMI_526]
MLLYLSEVQKTTIIGIDFGTSAVRAAVWYNDHVAVLPNEGGNCSIPAYISFDGPDLLVGEKAKLQARSYSKNIIHAPKRLICDLGLEEVELRKYLPVQVTRCGGRLQITIQYRNEEKTFFPEDIVSILLSMLKDMAEFYLQDTITQAVISVPIYFNDSQRQAVKDAGTIASLDVVRITTEASAAAIAYAFEKNLRDDTSHIVNLLVIDLGESAAKVSIIAIEEGIFESISTSSNTSLGGEAFDQRILEYCTQEFRKSRNNQDILAPSVAHHLRLACEQGKINLSTTHETSIEVPSLNFSCILTRTKFESLCEDLFMLLTNIIDKVLADIENPVPEFEIHEILLVGGTSHIPRIRTLVSDHFDGREPYTFESMQIDTHQTIAFGAAILGAIHTHQLQWKSFTLVQLDATRLSLGIETIGGMMCPIFSRNRTIPGKTSELFSTTVDDQQDVVVKVYEGEHKKAKDNFLLGSFLLDGITPKSAGSVEIEITFDYDLKDVLTVTALEKGTGKTNFLSVNHDRERLSREECDRMVDLASEEQIVEDIEDVDTRGDMGALAKVNIPASSVPNDDGPLVEEVD